MVYVSASTEPAKNKLDDYVKQIQSVADFLHCDVMDGIFVKNCSLNAEIIAHIHSISTIPLDVHLMVENPTGIIENYATSGANIITLHYESYTDLEMLKSDLQKIRSYRCLAGVSIKLETEADVLYPFLDDTDVVLVMSVKVGKSGQEFNDYALKKMELLNQYRAEHNSRFLIEADGGITDRNCAAIKKAGANILVSGNYLFTAEDKAEAAKKLKE